MNRLLSFCLALALMPLAVSMTGCSGLTATRNTTSIISPGSPHTNTTYSMPTGAPLSTLYTVSVTYPGSTTPYPSPVYLSKPPCNPDPTTPPPCTDQYGAQTYNTWGTTNSYTTFSSNDPVTITVTKLSGTITNAVVLPSVYGITPTFTPGGSTLSFTTQPRMIDGELTGQKFSVEINGDLNDRLLIFADPEENSANVPIPKDTGVYSVTAGAVNPTTLNTAIGRTTDTTIYFGAGLYTFADSSGNPAVWTLLAGTTHVYIAGGAYILGAINAGSLNNLRINGRGVISGMNFPSHHYVAPPAVALIRFNGGMYGTIEGITLTDSPGRYFADPSQSHTTYDNFKLVGGWQSESDALEVGSNDVVKNCFINSDDDSIKLYDAGATVSNCVLWQGINGAVFQYGWGIHDGVAGNRVSDIDVIHADWGHPNENDALFSYVNYNTVGKPSITTLSTGSITDEKFTHITVDTPILNVFSIDIASGQTMSGFTITNLSVPCLTTDTGVTKTCATPSYYTCPDASTANCFANTADTAASNWTISKEFMNGQLITSSNYGSVSDLVIDPYVTATFDNGTNLLVNPDFDDGSTTPWTEANGGSVALTATHYVSSPKALWSSGRTSAASGPQQDVTTALLAGGQGAYTLGATLLFGNSATDTMYVLLTVTDDLGSHTYTTSCSVNYTSFTTCSSPISVAWTGTLTSAIYSIQSATSTANIYTDNTILQ